MLAPLRYDHVDVFSSRPYSGNSLAVFAEAGELKATQMALITRELRHFESTFLEAVAGDPFTCKARVFDLTGELDFAGHPLLGAASVLHGRLKGPEVCRWTLRLRARSVTVETTVRNAHRFTAVVPTDAYGRSPSGHGMRIRDASLIERLPSALAEARKRAVDCRAVYSRLIGQTRIAK